MRSVTRRRLVGVLALVVGPPLVAGMLYPVPDVREEVAWRSRHFGPAALPYLRRALADADAEVRVVAVRTLGSQPLGTAGVPDLIEVLADDRPEMRREAACRIGLLSKEAHEATPALIAALRDPDARVRKAAADAFRFFAEAARPAVPALVACLHDPDPDVRIVAMHSLRGVPGADEARSIVPALADRLLHDPNRGVRAQAAYCLAYFDPIAVEALARALDDPDENVRLEAGRTLEFLAFNAAPT